MAMRWSRWVVTRPPPAGGCAGAVHDQVGGAHLVLHAVGGKAGGDAGQPIALLGAQFGQAQHARRALGAGGGDGEDRILVDHGRRALGRHLDAFQHPALDMQVGHRLAADLALVLEGDVGAHFAAASDRGRRATD